jgi:hypothetical protein
VNLTYRTRDRQPFVETSVLFGWNFVEDADVGLPWQRPTRTRGASPIARCSAGGLDVIWAAFLSGVRG